MKYDRFKGGGLGLLWLSQCNLIFGLFRFFPLLFFLYPLHRPSSCGVPTFLVSAFGAVVTEEIRSRSTSVDTVLRLRTCRHVLRMLWNTGASIPVKSRSVATFAERFLPSSRIGERIWSRTGSLLAAFFWWPFRRYFGFILLLCLVASQMEQFGLLQCYFSLVASLYTWHSWMHRNRSHLASSCRIVFHSSNLRTVECFRHGTVVGRGRLSRSRLMYKWCSYCPVGTVPYGSKYSSHFLAQVRTHPGEKPFECDICWKGFTQKANLTAHVNCHRYFAL